MKGLLSFVAPHGMRLKSLFGCIVLQQLTVPRRAMLGCFWLGYGDEKVANRDIIRVGHGATENGP
jgi:hypothetical protein